MTPAEVLRRAADRVEVAWMRGDICPSGMVRPDDTCPVCALGALIWATGSLYGPFPGKAELRAKVGPIPKWNDAESQTAENVAATMRRLADELEAAS